jgi:hypothetical protein
MWDIHHPHAWTSPKAQAQAWGCGTSIPILGHPQAPKLGNVGYGEGEGLFGLAAQSTILLNEKTSVVLGGYHKTLNLKPRLDGYQKMETHRSKNLA